jgi:hypothetical protein
MTSKFDSKHDAITIGLNCAGRQDLYRDEKGGIRLLDDILKNPEIKIIDKNIVQFDYAHEDCTMIEFKNGNNIPVRIATTKFRDGFDLWLIDPDSGMATRV